MSVDIGAAISSVKIYRRHRWLRLSSSPSSMTASVSYVHDCLPTNLQLDGDDPGSSSEEDYSDMLEMSRSKEGRAPPRTQADLMRAAQIAQASPKHQDRSKTMQVSPEELLKAAKMAQAAGSRTTSPLLKGKAQPQTYNQITCIESPIGSSPPQCQSRPSPIGNRMPTYSIPSSSELALTQSTPEDFMKLDAAFYTVDTMALVGRLSRVDGLLPDLAVRVVFEYLRFLVLLIRYQDWSTTMLWPSPLVDLAWCQHVLDTFRYHSDCQSICGRFIHYNPDAELGGQEMCSLRYSRTISLYKTVFGDPPPAIWPSPVQDVLNQGLFSHDNHPSPFRQLPAISHDSNIFCRASSGSSMAIAVKSDGRADQIFDIIRGWEGISAESHVLVFKGRRIDPSSSLTSNDIRPGSKIDLVPATSAS